MTYVYEEVFSNLVCVTQWVTGGKKELIEGEGLAEGGIF